MTSYDCFFNTLTASDKYFLRNRKNLPQPIQMQLSKEQRICCQVFPAYVKSTSNSEIRDCESRG